MTCYDSRGSAETATGVNAVHGWEVKPVSISHPHTFLSGVMTTFSHVTKPHYIYCLSVFNSSSREAFNTKSKTPYVLQEKKKEKDTDTKS